MKPLRKAGAILKRTLFRSFIPPATGMMRFGSCHWDKRYSDPRGCHPSAEGATLFPAWRRVSQMMTSENQEKQTRKKRLYLISAIVIVSLLVGGLMIRSQRSMYLSPASTSPSTTLQTTVPTVQYPT